MARRNLELRELTGRLTVVPRVLAGRPLVAGAVALVLLAATVTFGLLHLRESAVAQARTDAVAAARQAVPQLLSYDHTTLEAEIPRRLDLLTGTFRDDYGQLLHDVVLPAAAQSALVTSAEPKESAVVSEDGPDLVTVLMFLNQTTTAQGAPPDAVGSRVRVTMERPEDRWLVSELTPV
ncbi:hypothetical protein [Pseudonocardia sp. NPDC049154]|uniref:hypothetical protein n=1 Tax=Pseudonocardia sp. NPDC049154 TaxID=3155501 RepID=UPI0033F183F9